MSAEVRQGLVVRPGAGEPEVFEVGLIGEQGEAGAGQRVGADLQRLQRG